MNSPLYYAINHKVQLLLDESGHINESAEKYPNYVAKSLTSLGYTEEEKIQNMTNLKKLPTWKEVQKVKGKLFGDNKEIIDDKKRGLDEIISYLIEKTDDIDAFIKGNPRSRQGCTALFLALEADDTVTCRKLINAGADVHQERGSCPTIEDRNGIIQTPNSFIYRVINFQAWNTLEMFLIEFTEKARPLMHRSGNFNITPFVYFMFLIFENHNYKPFEKMNLIKRFYPLFFQAGADKHEKTALGAVQDFIKI